MHPRRIHLVNTEPKGQETPSPQMTHILAELFKGLRDEPSTRAVAQKILLAIEDRENSNEPCPKCGCDGNHPK